MDAMKLRATFLQDGAVVIPGFFTTEELAAVNADTERLLAAPDPGVPHAANFAQFETRVRSFGAEAAKLEAFIALREHPRLREVTRIVLDGGFENEGLLLMATPSGTGQAWHQDTRAIDATNFNVNRLIYARDVDPDAGKVVYVPGSHTRGRIPHGGNHAAMPGEVALAPKAGTLVLLHSLCFHRVTINATPRPRVSINFRCRPQGCAAGLGRIGVYRNNAYDFATKEVVDA
jgi:hypothetical protein